MSDITQPASNGSSDKTATGRKGPAPIWRLGFRPFFLGAGLVAALFMILWLAVLTGQTPAPYFNDTIWHGHEMLFGFAAAMLAGFLLTASQNWTGIPGVSGNRLMALVLLWGAARVLPFLVGTPNIIYMIVDLGFMPATAYLMFPYLKIERQKHNRIFFVCFASLFLGNVLVHAHVLAPDVLTGREGLKLGLSGMVLALVIVGGRVIPFFTRNAVQNARINIIPVIEKLAVYTTFGWAIGKVFFEATWLAFALGAAAAVVHAIRWWNWHSWQTRGNPILWILHVGYLWLIVGFVLDALGVRGVLPSLATHAFAVGGIGVVGYGMMTRVALGHTGRPIKASPLIVIGYFALVIATAVRVFMPLINPAGFNLMVRITGSLWILAFLLFLWRYTTILLKPRADGKPG